MNWLKRLLTGRVVSTPATVKEVNRCVRPGDVIAVRGEWAIVMAIGNGVTTYRFEDDRCNVPHTMAS